MTLGRLRSAALFPVGPRARWTVVAFWAVVAAVVIGFGLPAKFEEAQKNDPVSFLPGETESVRALEALQRFPGAQSAPAVIVVQRPGGLTDGDLHRIRGLVRSIRQEPPPAVTGAALTRRAPDGTAAIVVAEIRTTGESETLTAAVEELRERTDRLARPEPVSAAVTGPAGYANDIVEVFGQLNSTLLVATASLVFVLLILIYRSPIFWVIPLATVGVAELASRGLGWAIAEAGVTVNGQSAGILLVLVFGAGTDYALLLVARYREELRRREDHAEAAAVALRRAGPAILASGATVIAALLVLSFAKVNGTEGLGPIGAMGVALAMATGLTLLPALLAVAGRRPFWPFVPRFGQEGAGGERGFWRSVGERVARRPRPVWVGSVLLLLILASGLGWLDVGLTQAQGFRGSVESERGQRLADRSFSSGITAPATVVVPTDASLDRARRVVSRTRGVASVAGRARRGPPGAAFDVVLRPDPYTGKAFNVVERLRDRLGEAGLGGVLVGGPTAEERDYRSAAVRDDLVIPPIVLAVVFIVLALILRALLLPLLLMATVVLSFAAALGVAAFVSSILFGFPGIEPTLPLIGFIFLVALGTDYNIFLMARAREEAHGHGTREGTLRALGATGAVITSAGIVLAGTFSTLAVLPLVALTQIGIIIAFGVLLDTFLVRSVLVPALNFEIGPRVWWPSTLARSAERRPRRGQETAANE